jgi:hypothetical protein
MPRRTLPSFALFSLLACLACDGDKDVKDPRVPFKLGENAGTDARVAPPPVEPVGAQGASYAPPIDQPALDGAPLALAIVRATLLADLDGDGDRDALALADAGARTLLHVALREPTGFATPRQVSGFELGLAKGCGVEHASLEALSTDKLVATLLTACGEPSSLGPTHHLLLSLEMVPRVYEHLELPPAGAGQPASLAVTAHSTDKDADGHADVVLAFTLVAAPAPAGAPAVGVASDPLELTLFDRPSGLTRDVREPETTLAAWASAALAQAAKSPEQAASRAAAVLAMRRALCREGGEPALRIGGAPGFTCGKGASSREAALALLLAHARRGHVAESFEAHRALMRERPDKKALERAQTALGSLPTEPSVTLREGPAVELTPTAPAHLPRARFLDEDTLFLRRRAPVQFTLSSATETPLAEPSDDLVRDPSGQLAVTAIEHGCAGYALRIERRPGMTAGYLPQPPVASAPLLPLPAPPGCTSLPEAERRDDGGFEVLGWAPQGVVAARGRERFVVPLSMEGKPTGPARLLEPGAPAPAPLPSGAALADGSTHAQATPYGVLVFGPQGVTLLRPDGYTSAVTHPVDVALSPSGRQVAVVSGGKVYLLSRGGMPTP